MNIDELLREQGERWQAPDLGAPDLDAALGQRRRRTTVWLSTVAAVCALAIGGAVWATRPATEVPAVPAPLSSPSVTPPAAASPSPTPTPTTDVPVDRIARVAVKVIDENSLGAPLTEAEVVGTTLGEVVEGVAVGGDRPVWVVQATGTFRCGEFSYCSRSRGGTGTGPILQVIIRQSDLSILHTATFGIATKLTDLGPVFGIDLDAAR